MTAQSINLGSAEGLKQLNDTLSKQSYLSGHEQPAQADFDLHATLKDSVDEKMYPHVARWAKHLHGLSRHFPTMKAATPVVEKAAKVKVVKEKTIWMVEPITIRYLEATTMTF